MRSSESLDAPRLRLRDFAFRVFGFIGCFSGLAIPELFVRCALSLRSKFFCNSVKYCCHRLALFFAAIASGAIDFAGSPLESFRQSLHTFTARNIRRCSAWRGRFQQILLHWGGNSHLFRLSSNFMRVSVTCGNLSMTWRIGQSTS